MIRASALGADWYRFVHCLARCGGSTEKKAPKAKAAPAKPVNERTRLRAEFIKATNDYKASLEKAAGQLRKNVQSRIRV